MKRYEHWKKKTIYGVIGEAINKDFKNAEAGLEKYMVPGKTLIAYHHDTQQELVFTRMNAEGFFVSPDEEDYVLYVSHTEESDKIWAREYQDFHGFKELPNGEKVRRFKPLEEEEKYVRPEAVISIPENYVEVIEKTIRNYKTWLKENQALQQLADEAPAEKERDENQKVVTNHFKERFAGVVAKDQGDRLNGSQIKKIWEKFMRDEYRGFLNAHVNLTMKQLLDVGIDKFIYVMGWKKPSDVVTWRNNKLRVGTCCHCQDQFIPMMLQYNHGLCSNCRPEYSSAAIRNFVIREANKSKRYEGAQHDLLMDFYIMFYHDEAFRRLFRTGTDSAKEMEAYKDEVPEWAKPKHIQEASAGVEE